MGGLGSTRWANHKTAKPVCSTFRLSIYRANIQPDTTTNNIVSFGEHRQLIAIETGPDSGLMSVRYLLVYPSGKQEYVKTAVHLTTTRPHYGGLRWWFQCPKCKRRCAVLCLPDMTERYACRHCHSLGYLSSQLCRVPKWKQSLKRVKKRPLVHI